MERWVTTAEILQQGQISEINLIYLVCSGKLLAYDSSSFTPIDWHSLEEQFNEFSSYCEQKRNMDFSGGLGRVSAGDFSKKASLYMNIERIPIKALLSIPLTNRDFEVSYEQYFEIKSGWSNKQILECLDFAIFKMTEIELFFNFGNNKNLIDTNEKAQPNKTDPRVERTDILIIGGLLGLLKDRSTLISDAKVIQALDEWMPNTPGWSKRTLEDRFSRAREAIENID